MTTSTRYLPAAEQGRLIAAGMLDPVAQVELYLETAAGRDGRMAFARLTPNRARFEAMAARTRTKVGQGRSALDGVAISWMDAVDSAGAVTEAGSRLFSGHVPARDARALQQASAAGGVCLGKTQMTELGLDLLGVNALSVTPPNRHDPSLVTGGGASGGALSVTLGLCAMAVGLENGGGLLVPAAWNDLVGFRPGLGRVPLAGVATGSQFDTLGFMARRVEDCAQGLALVENGKLPDLRGADISGARLLVLEGGVFDDADPACLEAMSRAIGRLAKAGAKITVQSPKAFEALKRLRFLAQTEFHARWQQRVRENPLKVTPDFLRAFEAAVGVSADVYLQGLAQLHAVRQDWRGVVAGYDVVLMPTAASLAPSYDSLLIDQDFFRSQQQLASRNVGSAALLGGPVLTLPTGRDMVGLSLLGLPGEDEKVLCFGAAIEAALG
ncbi:amidase [Thioclava litoralis]|uniref:Amidase n=1 Tax=Thioclava litoralis TaxID=3076557 RepID=A0ABZ1E3K0_9RHOB|nr:amidase [Thioclava sp. FTW29]